MQPRKYTKVDISLKDLFNIIIFGDYIKAVDKLLSIKFVFMHIFLLEKDYYNI